MVLLLQTLRLQALENWELVRVLVKLERVNRRVAK